MYQIFLPPASFVFRFATSAVVIAL